MGKERKPAEGEAAELLRLALEASPSGMLMVDEAGVIVLANRQTERIFGYGEGELQGRRLDILVPPSARAAHPAHRDSYFKNPVARPMGAGRDLCGVRKDGSEIPIEIGLNPVPTPRGRFVLASIADITERKKAEEKFRLAVEAAPNAMVMVGGGGGIVLVNAQAEKLFGYDRAELMGKPIEQLVPERFRGRHLAYRGEYMGAPQVRSMGSGRELFALHKSGREIPVEIGLNPIRAASETLVLAAVVDITERRELQRKVAQNEAMAAVGAMAAVLAHEIRNPLGSIVMAAKSIASGRLSPEESDTVSAVLSEESQRLSRTLQDFLQFARPREPRRTPANLNHTVSEIVSALKSDAALAAGIEMKISLDRGLEPFPHDADQIRQVLWNLILNGIQAMNGSGLLRIVTEAREGSARCLVIDSGSGIPPAILERLFDPFFTTKQKGTGLGLAIAQRIVAAHGGRLTAENEPAGGARFALSLPLK